MSHERGNSANKFARVGASPCVGADLGAHYRVDFLQDVRLFFVAKPSLNATLE